MSLSLENIANDLEVIKSLLLNSKTIFNAGEAAKYLGIKPSTLYKMTAAGTIPFSKPSGKLVYFNRVDLDQWMLSNKTKGSYRNDIEAATFISKGVKR